MPIQSVLSSSSPFDVVRNTWIVLQGKKCASNISIRFVFYLIDAILFKYEVWPRLVGSVGCAPARWSEYLPKAASRKWILKTGQNGTLGEDYVQQKIVMMIMNFETIVPKIFNSTHRRPRWPNSLSCGRWMRRSRVPFPVGSIWEINSSKDVVVLISISRSS